ncbi:uncharacterized protein BJX67DRAFT_340876 [Aspergillus lucknowensis]|uniref:CENP-V/GFA domain-containing protein n=1 Tax=Aspergillus lucknowensis TaxID=176173 RepID=A0ABR4M5M4_9EURO
MDEHEPLHGSCLCGRNEYLIRIPDNVTDHAHVYFDTGRDNRRSYGTPLTAWLRVPLSWYQSHTQSYFPDETHGTIRRIFSPPHAPHTQRVFCGFCGSPLTYWSEEPKGEAEFMSVTIGSLYGDDQRLLEDLDLLPRWESPEESTPERDDITPATNAFKSPSSTLAPSTASESGLARTYRHGTAGGIPWFEEMIEGSGLGRLMKTRRGVGVSDGQWTTIEWEVSEWTNTGSETEVSSAQAVGKRKRGDGAGMDDA